MATGRHRDAEAARFILVHTDAFITFLEARLIDPVSRFQAFSEEEVGKYIRGVMRRKKGCLFI